MPAPITTGVWFMGGEVPDFYFDAVLSESIQLSAEVTKEPCETGVVVSDHYIKNPARLELEVVVSDTPLSPNVSEVFDSDDGRGAVALATLEGLMASGEPFNVQAGMRFFESVVIEDISTTRDARNAGWLRARIVLTEVRITSTETITYPPRKAGKTARQAAKPVTKGEQSTKPVETKEEARSILFQMLGPNSAPTDATLQGLLGGLSGATP
jgi:hypothetical protein